MKLSDVIEKYIKVRDAKAQLKKEYDEKAKKFDEALLKMEAVILKVFNDTGQDSAKTEFGTAYMSPQTSATVADRESFFSWVLEDPVERSVFLESRVSKSAVEQFKSANDDLPPGVNWRSEIKINVRRA